jgi:hypothetical protein
MTSTVEVGSTATVQFDHIQMYVDDLQSVEQYKKMEAQFTKFATELKASGDMSVKNGRELYVSKFKDESAVTDVDPASYQNNNLDLAQQMICGLGWAVTGSNQSNGTYSVLLNSPDADGAKFILTTKASESEPAAKKQNVGGADFDHFSVGKVDGFYSSHAGRPGVSVLGFEVTDGGVAGVLKNLKEKHPKLMVSEPHEYTQEGGSFKVRSCRACTLRMRHQLAFYVNEGAGDVRLLLNQR